jgi:hypothetical protein
MLTTQAIFFIFKVLTFKKVILGVLHKKISNSLNKTNLARHFLDSDDHTVLSIKCKKYPKIRSSFLYLESLLNTAGKFSRQIRKFLFVLGLKLLNGGNTDNKYVLQI